MKIQQRAPLIFTLALAAIPASGAIVFEHYYDFENAGNLGEDHIGSADFTSVAGLTQGNTSPTAGNYATFSTASAASGADISVSGDGSLFLVTTVRLDSLAEPYTSPLDFLATGGYLNTNSLKLALGDGPTGVTNDAYWASSLQATAWLGLNGNNGVGTGDQVATVGDWVQLALVYDATQNNGDPDFYFYINGTQFGAYNNNGVTPPVSNLTIGGNIGTGSIDEIKVASWDPSTDTLADVVTAFNTNLVPEPSAAMLSLSGLCLLLRRRNRS